LLKAYGSFTISGQCILKLLRLNELLPKLDLFEFHVDFHTKK
jgi:hypothetical protein